MKTLLLMLSIIVFALAGFYFASNLKYSTDLNYIIYMSTWLILILISMVGMAYNIPLLKKQKNQVKSMMYNSYSEKRIKNKDFDRQFQIVN